MTWYKKGLYFKCLKCGRCCSRFPGYVWITEKEIEEIAKFLNISKKDFIEKYTRQVNNKISLKENLINFDCCFLKDKKYSYPPQNAIDGNINTAWVEGVNGLGKGEWIKLSIDMRGQKGNISSIIFLPGYGKSEEHFKKNNRLKSILVKRPGYEDYSIRLSFADSYSYYYDNMTMYGSKIHSLYIYIEDVYKGSKYDDTCIGEIIVICDRPSIDIDG